MIEKLHKWLEKSKAVWIVLFGSLFILSIDFWNWDASSTVFDFLPIWIVRLIVLQLILAGTIYLFSKTYWRDR